MSNFTKSIVYSGVVLVAGLVAVFTIYNNMAVTDGAGYANIEPAAGISSAAPKASGIVSGANSMAHEAGAKATQAVENASKSIKEIADHGESHVDGEDVAHEGAEGVVEDIQDEATDAMDESTEEAVDTIVDEAADEALEEVPADATETEVEAAKDAAEDVAEDIVEDAADTAEDAAADAAKQATEGAAEDTATEGNDL